MGQIRLRIGIAVAGVGLGLLLWFAAGAGYYYVDDLFGAAMYTDQVDWRGEPVETAFGTWVDIGLFIISGLGLLSGFVGLFVALTAPKEILNGGTDE